MSAGLVTGATVGIGRTFAQVLAEEGRRLVLVARDAERLRVVAAELIADHRVEVEVLPADLGTDAGCAAVVERIHQQHDPIHTLVNNAGLGIYEPFGQRDIADEEGLLDLNVRAVLRLTHAAVRAMGQRGGGEILNVSSMASFMPRGIGATYAASKAWVTSFSECLAQQLAGSDVRIGAVCPGFVHTEFHQRAGIGRADVPDWMWIDAEKVVRTGLADLRAGKPVSVPGGRWKTMLTASRVIPRPVLRKIMRRSSL